MNKLDKNIIVVDVGGTKIRFYSINFAGEVIGKEICLTKELAETNPVDFFYGKVVWLREKLGIIPSALVLGLPISMDEKGEKLYSSPNIKNLNRVEIKSALKKKLNMPVHVDRDINLLLLGEKRIGEAKNAKFPLGVFFGTGIGASFLMNGMPYRGARGVSLELGHVPVGFENRLCICGQTDCLEAYVCGKKIEEAAKIKDIHVEDFFIHSKTSRFAADFVKKMAYGLATAFNLLGPDVLVIGGGIIQMKGFPKDRLKGEIVAHLRKPLDEFIPKIRYSKLGEEASPHGALELIERQSG